MKVRPVQSIDLPVIASTFQSTFNAAPWNEQWTHESALACLRDLLALPRGLALAVWDGSMCVGGAFGFDQQKDTALTHEIKEFFIHPDRQGQGMGKQLMKAYLPELEARGISSIYLLTARDSSAEQFYGRLGFRRARRQMVLVRP